MAAEGFGHGVDIADVIKQVLTHDEKGNYISNPSDRYRIIKGKIVTHNHPDNHAVFSENDLRVLIRFNLGALRVVDQKHTLVFIPSYDRIDYEDAENLYKIPDLAYQHAARWRVRCTQETQIDLKTSKKLYREIERDMQVELLGQYGLCYIINTQSVLEDMKTEEQR